VNRLSRNHARHGGYNPVVHFVYMVRCADGTLYTGYAKDPERRAQAHNAGRGAKYTSGRRPVSLVYIERFRSLGKALSREHALKRATRRQKELLIAQRERLNLHSRRPNDHHDGSRRGSFGN